MQDLPKPDPVFLVGELRDRARETAAELNEDIPEMALRIGAARKFTPQETLEWRAADCIEDLLKQITKDERASPRGTSRRKS